MTISLDEVFYHIEDIRGIAKDLQQLGDAFHITGNDTMRKELQDFAAILEINTFQIEAWIRERETEALNTATSIHAGILKSLGELA